LNFNLDFRINVSNSKLEDDFGGLEDVLRKLEGGVGKLEDALGKLEGGAGKLKRRIGGTFKEEDVAGKIGRGIST
jgi:hypothetical protein